MTSPSRSARPAEPRLLASGDRRLWSGMRDLAAALAAWRIWVALGISDITSRYRRTVLGPFWITLSIAFQALAIGFIFSALMGVPVRDYLPYVAVGLIVWQFMASTVNESSSAFSSVVSLIRNFPLPLGVHVLRTVWRNVLTLVHHLLFLAILAPFVNFAFGPVALLALVGLVLVIINVGWIAVVLSLTSVRFRDIPPMTANAMTMLFFVTPVIWSPERLSGHAEFLGFLTWNPAYHLIEVIRGPLLGTVPSALSFLVAIGCAVAGWVVALLLYGRYHWRVAYWL